MENIKEIARGAEAVLYQSKDKVIKHRLKKTYRVKEIDDRLRRFRSNREKKIFQKLEDKGFNAPRLLKTSEKDTVIGKNIISMDLIEGDVLKNVLEEIDYRKCCETIGRMVAELHKNSIIHSDLTTSNMILNQDKNKLYFIDFGLSYFSEKVEDMAVDLHLLRQALESKHHTIHNEAFRHVIVGYSSIVSFSKSKEVINRLEKVEKRGRNKHKE